MEFLTQYGSSTFSNENLEFDPRQVRQVYLVTYSQANTTKFSTTRSFAEAVVRSFSQRSETVIQWCCAQENHQRSGVHFHVAVKLKQNQRWLPAKISAGDIWHMCSLFKHPCKLFHGLALCHKNDTEYEESEGHPDLTSAGEPRTMKAHESVQKTRKSRLRSKLETSSNAVHTNDDHASETTNVDNAKEHRPRKRQRLSAYKVPEIIVKKNIKDRAELMAFANSQRQEEKTDLAEFVLNRGTKIVNEVISNAWEMIKADETLRRRNKSRMDILQETYETECTCEVDGEWETCALEILHNNDIPPMQFAMCVKEALVKGRGKYRNAMLAGPANCGKTFLFNPLNKIYHTFTNPASTSFAWVGAENSEVIFLMIIDFRWSPIIIACMIYFYSWKFSKSTYLLRSHISPKV